MTYLVKILIGLMMISVQANAKLIMVEDGESFIGVYDVVVGSTKDCYAKKDEFFKFPVDQVHLTSIINYQGIKVGDVGFNAKMFELKIGKNQFKNNRYQGSENLIIDEQVNGYDLSLHKTQGALTVVSPGVVELNLERTLVRKDGTTKKLRETHCRFVKR